jgi:hypothetical protein
MSSKQFASKAIPFLPVLLAFVTFGTYAQFSAGRTYRPTTNTDPVTVITGTDLNTNVPAYNASPTDISNLRSLYGTNLNTPGNNKADACVSNPTPTNAYLREECNSINYIRGNNNTRAHVVVDPVTDPVIVNGSNATRFPSSHLAGTPNTSGGYTACTTQTTATSAINNAERCEIGNEVTEGSCEVPLIVTVDWALYNNQPNADLSQGYCPVGLLRGDQRTTPAQTSFQTLNTGCAAAGLGTGSASTTYKMQCSGSEITVGYDRSFCSIPFSPPTQVAVQTVEACFNQPPTIDNCFNSARQFVTKTTVPLITERKDFAACDSFYQHQAIIR